MSIVWKYIITGLLLTSSCQCFVVNTTSELVLPANDINGFQLLDLGKAFNLTFIKLIGQAFVNIEEGFNAKLCQMEPCSHWSSWSDCSSMRSATFGAQTRTRQCWTRNSKPCANDGVEMVENESRICEGFCPPNYNYTTNKHCLLFNTTSVYQDVAEKRCQDDGGHIINVDTEERWTDFVTIVNGQSSIWMDGLRTQQGGEWSFKSGVDPDINGVSHWWTNQPNNAKNYQCRSAHITSGKLWWYDTSCTTNYKSVCEVRNIG